ncbi:MAG: hypothetical protein QNJ47_05950 [Nostocaceae cyanobacterium]|nr:hypothetical protein [Nostocaceae cyanobacterium]
MPRVKSNWLRILPLLVIGGLLFYFNSAIDLNYMVRGYFVLLEAQATILLLLLLTGKLSSKE